MSVEKDPLLVQYLAWATSVASIECDKAKILQVNDFERGLFCVEAIEPGETILKVPSSVCLSIERLQVQSSPPLSRGRAPETLIEWENWTFRLIGRVRQFAGFTGTNLRENDMIALFLIAGRHILKENGNRDNVSESQSFFEVDKSPRTTDDHRQGNFLPHVSMLPKSFPTHTMYYSDSELESIQGTNCHGFTVRMLQQMQEDYDNLRRFLVAYQIYKQTNPCEDCGVENSCLCSDWIRLDRLLTLKEYKWALCNIYSRCTDMGISKDEPHTIRFMVPVFDMVNHKFGSHVRHEMDHDGNICLVNGKSDDGECCPLNPGDEICFSYGNFPNEKLLLVYGFSVDANPYDAVSLYVPMPPSDPLFTAKAKLLSSACGIEDTNAPHEIRLKNADEVSSLPDSLLSVLRLIGVHTVDEIVEIGKRKQQQEKERKVDDGAGISEISVSNERVALSALFGAIEGMSKQQALNLVSLAQDLRISNESSVAGPSLAAINSANAQALCQSEFNILSAVLSELDERLEALDGREVGTL